MRSDNPVNHVFGGWGASAGACAVLSLIFVAKWVKETKGKELEDMRLDTPQPDANLDAELEDLRTKDLQTA